MKGISSHNNEVLKEAAEYKQREEALRQLNDDLEKRLRDCAAQLEAANRELDAFSYSVSHDLFTPLRHMTVFIEILEKSLPARLDEHSRHYFGIIAESGRQMDRMVSALLSFYRLRRAEMVRLPVDLNSLAREVVADLQSQAAERMIEWRVQPLPRVEGDKEMLRLVLSTLLSNALKFTRPRQQAVIEIRHAPEADEDILYVKDNGVGFDQQYADQLFTLFRRLHKADEFEGAGAGLANVRSIIQRHGGRVWAEGAVGEGATFCFALPKVTR